MKVSLDETVDGEEFYDAIVDSEEWSDLGYELEGEAVFYESFESEFAGFQMEVRNPDEVDTRMATFERVEDYGKLSIQVPDGETKRVDYNILGDEIEIQEDVASVISDALDTVGV